MRKAYVTPESKLVAININESIAYSGQDEVDGMASINFTVDIDDCRELYTNSAPVTTTGTKFMDYYNDLMNQVELNGMYEAYFNCFRIARNQG